MIHSAEINCDVGEGMSLEPQLYPYIHRVNIACGGHTGTRQSIKESMKRAQEYNIPVGAHPSYPDKENFGRKVMDLSHAKWKESMEQQLTLFLECAESFGIKMTHIKAHGALYHRLYSDETTSNLWLELMEDLSITCPTLISPGSILEKYKIAIIREGFLDRKYKDKYILESRQAQGAIIQDSNSAVHQLISLQSRNEFDSYCIHGDNPAALDILKAIQPYVTHS